MADRPLRPATDHRLGGPLPRQPANRPQPPPPAAPKDLCQPLPREGPDHTELPRVSAGYPLPVGRLATCSSPVRHGRPPKGLPCDLHALGTPPALILSQDQTLHQCHRGLAVRRPPKGNAVGWPRRGLLPCAFVFAVTPTVPPRQGRPRVAPASTPPARPATVRPSAFSLGMTRSAPRCFVFRTPPAPTLATPNPRPVSRLPPPASPLPAVAA